MNLILVEPEELRDGLVVLRGRRAEHILTVIGPDVGQTLRCGIVGGGKGLGTVVELAPSSLTIRLGSLAVDPPFLTSLVLAVPRPKVLTRVVRAVASMGVASLDLINAWRVEKSYFGSPVLEPAALALAARLGCEQGGHTQVPAIRVHKRFMLWLETLGPPGEQRYVCQPGAAPTLLDVGIEARAPARVALGPEGGWIARELDSLAEHDFAPISLSPSILTVETAIATLLGQLTLLSSAESKD